MSEICKPVLLILIVSSFLDLTESFDLQRLSERMDKLEIKILTDGMYTRGDIHKLQEVMGRIEGRLNLTYTDTEYILNQTALIEGLEISVKQLTGFKSITEAKLENISDSLQYLKEALENEVALSANTRRHVSELDVIISTLTDQTRKISGDVHAILSGVELLFKTVSTVKYNETDSSSDQDDESQNEEDNNGDQNDEGPYPTSCLDAFKDGQTTSGVYTVRPDSSGDPVEVYCDQDTDGGGWTVFQRRQDGSVDFYRNWQDYKIGFGELKEEFWLGNDKIHRLLLAKGSYELRVDLGDFDNNRAYAKYSKFMVGPESGNYVLTAEEYTGDAGDDLTYHNKRPFSTKDKDNDSWRGSCSQIRKGAWWYDKCTHSNLNGLYTTDKQTHNSKNVYWSHWKNGAYPLKFTEMKFREHDEN